ncbi:MAG TPA: rhodanese-like domain-containing protein [Candidatus Binataceae bacterium]|nr:rhodanese-like domain-containing protein [Candidatus Binataceae bacterium]
MKTRVISLAVLLAAVVGVAPVYANSLRELLANHETDSFKIIHVADLAALMARGNVMVFDANPSDVRAKEGVIPGAHLLPSSSHYDVATELPTVKTTKLVFYCHNTH